MRGAAVRIGILLATIGFGSVFLHAFTNYQFSYLMWAEGAQPYLGIVVGIGGLVLVGLPLVRRRQPWYDSTPTVPFARQQTWAGQDHNR